MPLRMSTAVSATPRAAVLDPDEQRVIEEQRARRPGAPAASAGPGSLGAWPVPRWLLRRGAPAGRAPAARPLPGRRRRGAAPPLVAGRFLSRLRAGGGQGDDPTPNPPPPA